MTLDSSQMVAVKHTEGPLLINAGAGSGKTRTLTHRLADLIERGVSPKYIFAGTFTKAAAQEMKERLAEMVGAETADKMGHIGTLHSFGYRVLKDFYGKKFDGRMFSGSMMSANQSTGLMRYLLSPRDNWNVIGLGIADEYGMEMDNLSTYVSTISRLKDDLITPEVYERRTDSHPGIARLYKAYEEAKSNGWINPKSRLNGKMTFDFGDCLIGVWKIFKENSSFLKKYQGLFKYVLVDEAQDNNLAQYVVMRMIAAPENNLTMVGDDYQSIYGFRGAAPSEFIATAEGATVVNLEVNYRSHPDIVGAAARLIMHNKRQLHKTCRAYRKD